MKKYILLFLLFPLLTFSQTNRITYSLGFNGSIKPVIAVVNSESIFKGLSSANIENAISVGAYYTSLGPNYSKLFFLRHGIEFQKPFKSKRTILGVPLAGTLIIVNAAGINFINKPRFKSFLRLESKLNLLNNASNPNSGLTYRKQVLGTSLGIHPMAKKSPIRLVFSFDLSPEYNLPAFYSKIYNIYNSRVSLEASF